MVSVGKEILRLYDEYGPIQVFDDGDKRTLMFGANDEQGCVLKRHPEVIQYDYVRAMLLVLLFQRNARHCLILGLGTGALATSLHYHCVKLNFDLVELRQAVIDTAYSHFYLPREGRLNVVQSDAGKFLTTSHGEYDLIFSDLYHAMGMDIQQGTLRFLDRCQARLATEGWLVLNYWQSHRRLDILPHLARCYTQVWTDTIGHDNWIIYASNSPKQLSKKDIKGLVKTLNGELGFSLSRVASKLTRLV